ncbi:MAG: hypothetical protein SGBAC_008871 [Bacillariaceae sp.]
MILPPKSGSGSSTTRDTRDTRDSSLQELVAASFETLEDNLNDILAFEEEAEKKNDDFDRARKIFATPSERYMMPSPRVATKGGKPSPVQEAKKRLSLSSDYSTSRQSGSVPKKRMSLTSDSSWMKSSKEGSNDGEIIKPSSIRRLSANSVQSATRSPTSNKNYNGDHNKQVSPNKLSKKPSEKALRELKELSSKFESDMEITELRQELHRASINYEILGNEPPFGIQSSERSDTGQLDVFKRSGKAKRISFSKDLPQSLNEEDVVGVVKERLNFFRTSLQEYTEQQQAQPHEVSESDATDDTSKDQYLSKEINTKRPSGASLASVPNERRLSDVTLDTAIANNDKGKRPSHVVTVEDADDDDEKIRVAKAFVYADMGESMQTTPTADNKSSEEKVEKKSKFGESFTRFFRLLKTWFQRRIEAFVASFTPKEQMIVKQMG